MVNYKGNKKEKDCKIIYNIDNNINGYFVSIVL